MPGNPAARKIGDKSGLWRVVVIDYRNKQIVEVREENIPYDEAFRLSSAYDRQFRNRG
jgi:hypothetical protein